MNDVISRNAAITTAKNTYTACRDRSKEDYRDMLIACLEELPFAQLEIIRCKECKHGKYDIFDRGMWCELHPSLDVTEDDFCSYAERREE